MVDALSELAPFSWRGETYPLLRRRVSFRHEGVEHVIQYRDFAVVEQLGVQGLTFSYTLPMRQSVAKGPYRNLFGEKLAVLTRDMLNREPGTLYDPVFAKTFRCTPAAYDDETDPVKRCGTDVSVEFKYAPELTDEDQALLDLAGVPGLASEAGALDAAVATADWAQEPSPEPSVDVLQAADGVVSQGLAQVDKFSASLDDFALKMENIEKTCERAENPQNWSIRDSARRNREAAIRLKRRLSENPATKLRQFATRSQRLVTDLAKEVGMTVEEFLRLNPSLVRLPYVPAGTVVIVKAQPRAT